MRASLSAVSLRNRGLVEAVDDAAALEILHDDPGQLRVVVAEFHGAGAGEEVDVAVALLVVQERPPGQGTDATPNLGRVDISEAPH